MVFKNKQPKTDGIVVGRSKRKLGAPNLKKSKNIDWQSKKTAYAFIVGIACVLFTVIIGLYLYGNSKGNQVYELSEQRKYANDFLNSNNSNESKDYLISKYSQQYGVLYKGMDGTNPSEWNKSQVDDAYALLLYVDKMGSFSQALQYISQLESAKASGVNIDDNSYGITQAKRDEILQRSKEAATKQLQQKGDKE